MAPNMGLPAFRTAAELWLFPVPHRRRDGAFGLPAAGDEAWEPIDQAATERRPRGTRTAPGRTAPGVERLVRGVRGETGGETRQGKRRSTSPGGQPGWWFRQTRSCPQGKAIGGLQSL